ncbi:MAG: hypothetical protein V7L14_15340 [Nostoc sp.]|uniref:hypothetical protein n=1 Tax=Nostoc sp. TaxID=1180 RepID=UPI002FF6FCC0
MGFSSNGDKIRGTRYNLSLLLVTPPWTKRKSKDYLAIASRADLGNRKFPTVFVYQLVDGQYQVQKFTGSDRILSTTFPELAVTVKEVVAASQIQKL